jgi:soluble lytic murein transglycosylase
MFMKKFQVFIAILAGLLGSGAFFYVIFFNNSLRQIPSQKEQYVISPSPSSRDWRNYSTQSFAERITTLSAIADKGEPLERCRARYLLATNLIQQGQGQKALNWLQGLEQDYPVLAAQIAVKRAQAYAKLANSSQTQKSWEEVLNRYANSPVVVEALFVLGQQQPKYWERAITEFPKYPRTMEIVQKRLKQNPDQFPLWMLLAKQGLYLPDYVAILDNLVSRYSQQLQSQDWQTIAFGYWEHQEYLKSGKAYSKAPLTPRNLYRSGRGLQLADEKLTAEQAYQQLLTKFPQSDETGLALLRLAKIVPSSQALTYLDQAIAYFPKRTAAALLAKIQLLQELQRETEVVQAQQILLQKYGDSVAADELRWILAQQQERSGKLEEAIRWGQQIKANNPDAELAPKAAFWVGKWTQRLGRSEDARLAFQKVLERYPASYYAWRSTVALGWDVGDFTTVRNLDTCRNKPCIKYMGSQYLELTAGSDAVRELYRIGQDRESWEFWQVEYKDAQHSTVSEQFTDGLLRQGVGDYLNGIFMVSSLAQREDPAERSQYRQLREQSAYWQALYPLPYPYFEAISTYSTARRLNLWMVVGLIRQESRFQYKIHSSAGAVGLMQVLPETASWIAAQLKVQHFSLENPVDNINLGTWYLDHTHDEYENNSMLAIASYNAGPNKVADWVKQFGLTDLDNFVESIPYDETRDYVKAVFENYWNYLRLYSPEVISRGKK